MNHHDHALVPLDGVGRFAEAFLRHDRVSVLVRDPETLAKVLAWFVDPGEIETLLIWLRNGVVDFADPEGDFRTRVLEHPAVAAVMHGQYRHVRLKTFGRVRAVAPPDEATATSPALSMLHLASHLEADLCLPHAEAREACGLLERFAGFQTFEASVQFPPVRQQVDDGRMDLRRFIDLRREAKPIREWMQRPERGPLQQLVALHDAVGRRMGVQERSVLRLCGDLHRTVTLPPGSVDEPEAAPELPSELRERFTGSWRPWIFDSG